MILLALTAMVTAADGAVARSVALFDGRQVADIVHADDDSARLAADLLARDLTRLTGRRPRVLTDAAQCRQLCVVVGAADTPLVRTVAADAGVPLRDVEGQWERYVRVAAPSRAKPSRRYLLIAGSDRRGAVWGVIDLTREIGVSAWEWWADVTTRRAGRVTADGRYRLSAPPSVQYRGIFLNDEDWGLQPWAAKTHEPEVGDIGPRTYARIFELMWRLKANFLWPAMHDSTRPFYQVPGNADMARAYDVVLGTSHAEPMMRNNVREWDDARDGAFNFFTNRAAMTDYWRRRVEAVRDYENIYSVGLRGRHDSAMEGADTPDAARDAMADAHLHDWAARQFGADRAAAITDVMTGYYDLAFERRPEFMGFNQVEPTRPVHIGDYVRSGGGEAETRIDRYAALTARAEALAAQMPADRRDAFFQLVLYPVRAAASLNTRNLTLDLAALRTRQGGAGVNALADRARAAHARIVADTRAYDAQNGGKWRHMMDMAPRRLPVFTEPAYPRVVQPDAPGCTIDADELVFVAGRPATHVLTIRSRGRPAAWSWRGAAGLSATASSGRLDAANGFEQRVAMTFDGRVPLAPATLRCQEQDHVVTPRLLPGPPPGMAAEYRRIVSMAAADAALSADWERVPGLGSRGTALRSRLTLDAADGGGGGGAAPLSYRFVTGDEADAELRIVALPAHALTGTDRLRIAVQVDDGATETLDFETHGRSEEWKRNVLSNSAQRTIRLARLTAGTHRLRIRALDPGFLLDRIDLRLDGAPDLYGAPPTR